MKTAHGVMKGVRFGDFFHLKVFYLPFGVSGKNHRIYVCDMCIIVYVLFFLRLSLMSLYLLLSFTLATLLAHINTAGAAQIQIITGEKTEHASIKTN